MAAILDDMEEPLLVVKSDQGTDMHRAPLQHLLISRAICFFTSKNYNIKYAMVECFQWTLQGIIHRDIAANRMRYFVHILLWPSCRPITPPITAPWAWCCGWWWPNARHQGLLTELNGHDSGSLFTFPFNLHTPVIMAFRPGLKQCTVQVVLIQALYLLLG